MANFPIENRVKLTYNTSGGENMAEFCPECWNKLNNFSDPAESYRLSWGYELCEGCSEFKRVVVGKRKHYWHLIVLKKLFQKRKGNPNHS